MSLLFVATMCLLYSHYRTYGYNDNEGDFFDNVMRTPRVTIQWNVELDDDYFDRVILVGIKELPQHNILTTGVLLDEDHVLTSYNPYRDIVRKNRMHELIVALLRGKLYNVTTESTEQLIDTYNVKCYSQVSKISEAMLTKLQWHGEGKVHSPVHDLFVLQIDKKLNLELEKTHEEYTVTGPKTIQIADVKDWLGPTMKFASLGFKSKAEIVQHDMLSTKQYEEDYQPIVNCEEWMIRDWGWFICLENRDLNKGIGSGAVLVYNETLFGIGSFTLKKGNSSIFVFTDVRPYRWAIQKTCR